MKEPQAILDQLKQPLEVGRVQQRPGAAGKKLSYLETHDVIDHLNTVFGFDGWDCKPVIFKLIPNETAPVGYVAVVSLSVQFGETTIERCGTGWGTIGKGNYELGAKEAESDALKRAARTLGDQFGNSLYEKDAPEHAGQQRAAVLTETQYAEYRAAHAEAVKLGVRLKSGDAPPLLGEDTDVETILDRTAKLRAQIEKRKQPRDKTQPDAAAQGRRDSVDRWAALNQKAQTGKGYLDFLKACQSKGLRFAGDDDIAAFENAATPKTDFAVIAEDIADEDWRGWAVLINDGKLTWEVTS